MPAVSVENTLVLPRLARPDPARSTSRPVARTITATAALEGAGFQVWRPFPGGVDLHVTDPKYYSSIKYWQTPTTPTNYRQWTDAWAQVKG